MKCCSTQKRTVYELSAIQKRWSSSKKPVFRKKCAKIAKSYNINKLEVTFFDSAEHISETKHQT